MGILDKIKNDKSNLIEKKVNPIEIFKSLNHKIGYEYLRQVQATFLKEWWNKKDKRDIVGVADTGSGKTLIGLLMLYSKMNEGIGPVVYLCPDNQLVKQVIEQANLYGIPAVEIIYEKNTRQEIPLEFINSHSILVTTFEKMYNGLSIFGVSGIGTRDVQEIGALLIDDAHTCIKKARKQSTFVIPNNNVMYTEILNLFEEDLEKQGIGILNAIKSKEKSVSRLVPYWAYQNKINSLKEILENHKREENFDIYIPFDLIFDYLEKSSCYISGQGIEITPLQLPLLKIPSFNNAKHRFILSATYKNMSDLIIELGISEEAVKEPINIKNESEAGERLIIAPKRFSRDLDENHMKSLIQYCLKNYNQNIVILVSNMKKAEKWKEQGALIVDKANIIATINKLKNSKKNLIVLVNRYDGIDLIGDMCHILVVDGLPRGASIRDKAMSYMRSESPITKKMIAQTIEQGLGRSVRSSSDYCVTFLLDNDLLNFISNNNNRKYFNEATRAQLNLGIDLSTDSINENKSLVDAQKEIIDTIDVVLNRNEDWISYYRKTIEQYIESNKTDIENHLINLAEYEHKALSHYNNNKFTESLNIIREKFINNKEISESDKGWYCQLGGQIINRVDTTEANDLQIKAKELNANLLIPANPRYSKKTKKTDSQIVKVKEWIMSYDNATDLKISIDTILSKLIYTPSIKNNVFEENIKKLGEFLGYSSSRPEQEYNDGPDNLWLSENNSFIIECKNEGTSEYVPKKDMEQILHSLSWYGDAFFDHGNVYGLILRKSNVLASDCHASKNIYSVNIDKLNNLKSKVTEFSIALAEKSPSDWSTKEIEKMMRQNHLLENQFIQNFTINFKRGK